MGAEAAKWRASLVKAEDLDEARLPAGCQKGSVAAEGWGVGDIGESREGGVGQGGEGGRGAAVVKVYGGRAGGGQVEGGHWGELEGGDGEDEAGSELGVAEGAPKAGLLGVGTGATRRRALDVVRFLDREEGLRFVSHGDKRWVLSPAAEF